MTRQPRERLRRSADPSATHVFVPGILGIGLLVSLAVLLFDAVRRVTAGRTHERHARIAASQIVAGVEAAARGGGPGPPSGRRPRVVYGVVAALLLSLGLYTLVGSTANFLHQEWVKHITWVWAASALAGVSLVWTGVCAAAMLISRDKPPAFVHPLLRRTPLGGAGDGRGAG